jgi:hypothetical protein
VGGPLQQPNAVEDFFIPSVTLPADNTAFIFSITTAMLGCAIPMTFGDTSIR